MKEMPPGDFYIYVQEGYVTKFIEAGFSDADFPVRDCRLMHISRASKPEKLPVSDPSIWHGPA